VSKKFFLLTAIAAIVWHQALAQIEPAEGVRKHTPDVHALTNLSIVVGPGRKIEKGTIIVRDGLIEAAGENVAIPADARVWNCAGMTAYAGLIDLSTDVGQIKPKSSQPGQQTPDQIRGSAHWNPQVHPEVSGAEQFLPDKETTEKFRGMGFTTLLTAPGKGIFHGSSALIDLGDGNANTLLVKDNVTQNISFSHGAWDDGYPNSLMGAIALIRQTFIDAEWYGNALKIYAKNPAQERPEENESLAALESAASGKQTVIFETTDEQNILRAAKIAKEFSLSFWIRGNGYEYRRLDAVKKTEAPIILPVNFPDPPAVGTPEEALNVSLEEMRHWDFAPENPSRLRNSGVTIALTTATLKDVTKFRSLVRVAIERGLNADDALASLTTVPASLLGMSKKFGTIEAGKAANFVLADGELFGEKTKIRETWVDGQRYEVKAPAAAEARGSWHYTVRLASAMADTGSFVIDGEPDALSGTIKRGTVSVKMISVALTGKSLALMFAGDSLGFAGVARLTGTVEDSSMKGNGEFPDGSSISWSAKLAKSFIEPPDTSKKPEPVHASFEVTYPEVSFGRKALPVQPENILVKGGYVWTSGPAGNLENTDILYKNGKVAQIGKNIAAPKGATVIDAAGKNVTAGLIDCHSHTAISEGVNEAGQAISAEVRIGDVVDGSDVAVYRELAGGLTVANLLHGSANPIGGQNQVVKLRWGMLPDEMKFSGAPEGIKFALGENVKQSNWGDKYTTRYPQTRMGVEQIIRDEFRAAQDYEKKMDEAKKNPNLIPPHRDLELDAIVEILHGERWVHSHSYRQDEILMLMRVADDFGFKIRTFQHGLEGYKVAELLAKHGAGVSTFSDWWAYKYEVIDAIPYNGALMHDVGVVVSYNSDSDELARRLNTEAAKAVKYGGVSEEEALKFVTMNPARQLGIDSRVGSIEVGKDADFVVWSGSPLSTYSVCEQTWIDGRKYFDRDEDRSVNEEIQRERSILIQKILKSKSSPGGGSPSAHSKKSSYSCHVEEGGAE